MEDESVCIIDFCGNEARRQAGHSADWWPGDGLVYFNGAWRDVPPMPASSLPTDTECEAWADQHDPHARELAYYRQGVADYWDGTPEERRELGLSYFLHCCSKIQEVYN